MENYEIYLPEYSIGTSVYEKIPQICQRYGTVAVMIGGHKALAAAESTIKRCLNSSSITINQVLWYGGDATYENVEALKQDPAVQEADMIFAVGGGKALDTCKALAYQTEKPVFTFPTISSNCAATTAVSIMYHADGTFKEPYFFEKPPVHTFISTEIIAKAPYQYLWAGMGDTYAKYFEAAVSSRDEILPHYLRLGVNISQMCVDPVLENGEQALEDNKKGRQSKELEQVILAIVVTTGIASILLTREHTPHYNSGLAHAIFYSLTAFPQIEKKHLHGEVVGYGVLLLLLYDGQKESFQKIYEFHKKTGLPVKLKDIEITHTEMESILEQIKQASDVNHYPYRIETDKLLQTIDQLENM